MGRLKRRLMVVLAGRLDQVRLEELRRGLGMARAGRLTDREDAQFGSRDFGHMVLELWRDEDDQWHISLDAVGGAEVSDDDIARWRAESEAKASAVGLTVVEVRSFPPDKRPSHQTEWRNENWLRTAKWDLPARTLPELWSVLGLSASATPAEKLAELRRFMASPVWEAAPERIQQEAEDFLR